MTDFGSFDDAISRLKYGLENPRDAKPIAVLAGAGTSHGSVPGVVQIVQSIRKMFEKEEQVEFDRRLASLDSQGLKYQAAFLMLAQRRPAPLRDRVVRLSVLKAYPPLRERSLAAGTSASLTEAELFAAESDVDGWTLTPGVEALGRIWAGLPPALRGPIITTNFDPLIEIAIRRAGAVAVSQWMDSDGSFLHHLALSETCSVIHLHGFWRDSQTLSMTAQLTQARDALAGSLRALLGKYTLLVVGYSGWRDAVMIQLERILAEQGGAQLDVLWCAFAPPAELGSELQSNPQLAILQRAPGNVQFYAGVDVNTALPALERAVGDHLTYVNRPRLNAVHAVPSGWTPVDNDLLSAEGQRDSRDRAIAFFDGREPTLRDAFNPHIPRRDVVMEIARDLTRGDRIGPTLTMLVGASGEGKSTALVQLCRDLYEADPNASLLWNSEGGFPGGSDIVELPSNSRVYLLVDNADAGVSELKALVRRLNESSTSHIHIVAAARDTDWHAVGGASFAWRNYVSYRVKTLRGLSRPDAAAIVTSWEVLGAEALGELNSLSGHESRINSLMSSAADDQLSGDGTLLGAALSARFGSGLVDHIRQLALRLRDRTITDFANEAHGTLLDALTYVSIPHAAGVRSLTTEVLGDIYHMSEPELAAFVLGPLGDEAPMSVVHDRVVTRHRLIATAVLTCAEELGVDVEGHLRALVKSAVRRIDQHGPTTYLRDIAYISGSLPNRDQALVAARAAADANPNRLSYRARLSSVLRECGRAAEAEAICRTSALAAPLAEDSADGIRGLLTEWGVCWGKLSDHLANAYLAAVAMADLRGALPPTMDGIRYSLRCLGHALTQAWLENPVTHHALAVRGVLAVLDMGSFSALRPAWQRSYEQAASAAPMLAPGPGAATQAILTSTRILQATIGPRFEIPGLGATISMDGLRELLVDSYGR